MKASTSARGVKVRRDRGPRFLADLVQDAAELCGTDRASAGS
jgi:hypothetical protein